VGGAACDPFAVDVNVDDVAGDVQDVLPDCSPPPDWASADNRSAKTI
jgi:hypothetical protein